jgi:diaminohydroxyphosphoribosylaminopyrimidine deaminase/5-amino-6-(5-phosphoribosylamino)uracil reductase
MFTPEDHRYMSRALELAALGLRTATPNPRVGCVVVREGRVIGEGWHRRAGEPHRPMARRAGRASTSRSSPAVTTAARRPA